MKLKMKNILSGILFLIGLVGLLLLLSLVFQPKNNTAASGMEDVRANGILSEPEQTIDVLFLGNSVSYCSIIPMQIWKDYGITSYLCGTSLQKLYYTEEFLQKAFETQSPKVVFLGVSPMFDDFEYEDELVNKVERIFSIFRYHDRWKTMSVESDAKLYPEYTYEEAGKGYYYSLAQEALPIGDYTYYTSDAEEMPEECRDAVKRIKEFCDERGVQLIFVSEPNASGAWEPMRYTTVSALAEELGVEYIEMNYLREEVPINWLTDSFDYGDHLNYYGAQKVTSYLGKYLSDMGIFRDKREDEAYASWNETQKVFYEGKPQ